MSAKQTSTRTNTKAVAKKQTVAAPVITDDDESDIFDEITTTHTVEIKAAYENAIDVACRNLPLCVKSDKRNTFNGKQLVVIAYVTSEIITKQTVNTNAKQSSDTRTICYFKVIPVAYNVVNPRHLDEKFKSPLCVLYKDATQQYALQQTIFINERTKISDEQQHLNERLLTTGVPYIVKLTFTLKQQPDLTIKHFIKSIATIDNEESIKAKFDRMFLKYKDDEKLNHCIRNIYDATRTDTRFIKIEQSDLSADAQAANDEFNEIFA